MENPVIPPTLPQNEHDLLVTIHGQVGRALTDIKDVKDDIKSMRENISERVAKLEETKVGKKDMQDMQANADKIHDDHEDRLRAVEKQSDDTATSISTSWKAWSVIATVLTLLLAGLSIYLRYK